MAAKVLLQKNNRTGKFTFSLLSARGHVIAASEPYESKRGAIAALNAFRKNAADAILVDETTEPKQPTPVKRTAARAAKTAVGAARAARSRTAAAVEGNGRRATGRTATAVPAENTPAAKTTARRPRKAAAKRPSATDAEG